MCFINDYDWYASVATDEETTADKSTKCFECHRAIPAGETFRHIDQQEHEVCTQDPESDYYEGEETDQIGCKCEPGKCDFGETFSCDICTECTKLLKAIEASEIEEGCSPDESQPGFGELCDAMSEDDGGRYRAKAAAMFPEIAGHVAKYYPDQSEDD